MNLSQYLCHRGSKALTNEEAKAIGIDLKKGWWHRHYRAVIPLELAEAVTKTLNGHGQKGILREAAKRVIAGRLNLEASIRVVVKAPCVEIEVLSERSGDYEQQLQAARKHPNYSFIVSDAFLASYEWKQLRYLAIKKQGRKCQCCGASPTDGVVIHVDHIKSRRTHPGLALDFANLQILCGDCNLGKGNRDSTDWRYAKQKRRDDART